MPVVAIPIDDLNQRLETQLSTAEMEQYLEQLGCDIEEFTQIVRLQCLQCEMLQELTLQQEPPSQCPECNAAQDDLWKELGHVDVVRMDLLPVRPDIFDPGGLSRAIRGLLKREVGLPVYDLAKASFSLTVDPIVSEQSSYRPYIACAVIRGLSIDNVSLRLLMKLQENLHWALGRDRKLASIGVYDLDTLEGPFRYTAVAPDSHAFTPLQPQEDSPQTPQQILEAHPKGVDYAHLLKDFTHVPLLLDAKDQVLSMPPIINSHETRVTTQTKDVFIDVTGITQKAVTKTLHTLVTSILELWPQAKGEHVEIVQGETHTRTPSMETEEFLFDINAATRLIGISLDQEKAIGLLRQMRHDVRAADSPDHLQVTVAPYRNDLMHEVDLMEDLAIAYGYQNIVPSLVPTMTVAQERPERIIANRARSVLTGLGFFETMSLLLSNAEEQYDLLNVDDPGDAVLLQHPASVEQTLLRTMIMPQLLKLFAINRGQGLPQKLFEVDDIVRLVPGHEEPEERMHLAAGILDTEVGFADLKALSEAISHELGMPLTYAPLHHPGMLPGRAAQLLLNDEPIGLMGEIHPSVLEKLRLTQPIVALEIDLTPLI